MHEDRELSESSIDKMVTNIVTSTRCLTNTIKTSLREEMVGQQSQSVRVRVNIMEFTRSLNKAITESLMDELVDLPQPSSTSLKTQLQATEPEILNKSNSEEDKGRTSCRKQNSFKDIVEHVFESLDAERRVVRSSPEDNVIEKSADTSSPGNDEESESVDTHVALGLLA